MSFVLLPAVDVAGGRVVRSGPRVEAAGPDLDDPLGAALAWQASGAEWIHLVDLDAAYGRGSNADLLAGVVGALDVAVELSGGIDDDASLARALATGCARVNLGTAALADPDWCARAIAAFGERVACCLDVRVVQRPDRSTRFRLAARGATTEGDDLWDALARLDAAGCGRYVVTDVGRDGTLGGPNLELYRAVGRSTATPVLASGGISSIDDLVALAAVAAGGANLEGAVVGRALYAGRFTLPEALDAVRRIGGGPDR